MLAVGATEVGPGQHGEPSRAHAAENGMFVPGIGLGCFGDHVWTPVNEDGCGRASIAAAMMRVPST